MRKMMKYSRAYGGADPELVEGDVFRMVIRVPEAQQAPGKYPASTGQVTGQVEDWIIKVLFACLEPQKSAEIQEITGIKHRETFQRNYLDRLLNDGLLDRTIPDKPRSRLQAYCTTDKGKTLLGAFK